MEMSDEQSSYYYKHRQEGHPQYGPALRCPTCGGTNFSYTEVGCLSIKKEKQWSQ
jgi:hypothetical protein